MAPELAPDKVTRGGRERTTGMVSRQETLGKKDVEDSAALAETSAPHFKTGAFNRSATHPLNAFNSLASRRSLLDRRFGTRLAPGASGFVQPSFLQSRFQRFVGDLHGIVLIAGEGVGVDPPSDRGVRMAGAFRNDVYGNSLP